MTDQCPNNTTEYEACVPHILLEQKFEQKYEAQQLEIKALKEDRDTLFSKLDKLADALNNRFTDLYKTAVTVLIASFVLPIIVGVVFFVLNYAMRH